MRWIREHKIITSIVAVILALAIIFGISFASGGNDIISRSAGEAVAAGEDAANSGISGIKNTFSGIFAYKKLQEENAELKEEVEKLKQDLLDAEVTKEQIKQLKSLSKSLNYKAVKKGDVVSADIISFDGTTWMNSFTINAGSKAGIRKNDVVVCGTGLVGRVSAIGKNWAKVSAVVDENSKTSFTVKRDSDILGMLSGDGKGELTGYVLDADDGIIEGDTLLTSGMGMYPLGIEIGVVTAVDYNSDTQLKNVTVEPSADFRGITKVTVII